MTTRISSLDDLRNYVDSATSGWHERANDEVERISRAIQAMEHPRWGSDWSEFLGGLCERVAAKFEDQKIPTRYVIAIRYHYYGPRTGQWTLHTVDADGVPMRDGMVAQYATREDARRIADEMHCGALPDGAGDRETRVMRADSRMARRLMRR